MNNYDEGVMTVNE